jgi:predicted DNA-binding antitoxin AbrB/MazE fold protein
MLARMQTVEALYEAGVLRPTAPLTLLPGERVRLIVVRHPDPRRWDLERLRTTAGDEDGRLAERGLADWAAALEEQDRP